MFVRYEQWSAIGRYSCDGHFRDVWQVTADAVNERDK